jgi:hypothetical protein
MACSASEMAGSSSVGCRRVRNGLVDPPARLDELAAPPARQLGRDRLAAAREDRRARIVDRAFDVLAGIDGGAEGLQRKEMAQHRGAERGGRARFGAHALKAGLKRLVIAEKRGVDCRIHLAGRGVADDRLNVGGRDRLLLAD